MDPSKGRGRGLALLQALKKSQMMDSPPQSEDPSPEATPGPSIAPSLVSGVSGVPSSLGGRGRASALLSQLHAKPSFSPASDVKPSPPAGTGRGLKLLQSLHASIASKAPSTMSGQGDVAEVTKKMAASSIVSDPATTVATSVGKNKYLREVKDTPPVVKKGETGTPIDVTANFVYLKFEENFVYEYEVRFDPNQDYKKMRAHLLFQHKDYFKVNLFDDGTTLYVPHMLPDEALNLVSTNPNDGSKVDIKIIFRRTRRLSEMLHLYNVLFKRIMGDLELVRFGRQHFNERSAIQIPQYKLEVWPGYVTAVDEYEGGLMLTLDSTHRVLRTETVLSLIKDCVREQGTNWKKAVSEKLIGSSVMTTYNKKLYRVDSIDDTITPRSTFEKNVKGQTVKVSYIDYFKQTYNIDIKDWDQPMLISRDQKRVAGYDEKVDFMICLVPETCQLTGLTDDQRSDFRLMKDVATYTRITPNQRHAAFKKYIQNVLSNEQAKSRLSGWGLSIAQETIDITARVLPPEPLLFGNGVKIPGKPDADWNREVTNNAVMQAVDLMRWAILYTEKDKACTMGFLDILKRSCNPMGIHVSQPELIRLPNDRTDSYIAALKKFMGTQIQMIVAICPTSRDDRYAAIKRICCVDNPIPSQVINARTIMNQKKVRSVTQKILLQINCKLGGTLWHIPIPYKTAMVIGIDTYHEANRKKGSVCAFVASYNAALTQWYSKAIFQEKGQELSDSLKSCLVESLKHYINVNGRFPDRIIIYRDGVGDGQLPVLQKYEIPQMLISFTSVVETYKPSLTYIVVQKRINTRIFMKTRDGFQNPPPGSVVDHDITRRDWYDFLIVSQKVNQGTVTPTHYVVIYDDSGMTPDQCQRLTYKMCHLYYNWPGTVRVPAPCQYAHKLAYLVGQSVGQEPSEKLADKLFFL